MIHPSPFPRNRLWKPKGGGGLAFGAKLQKNENPGATFCLDHIVFVLFNSRSNNFLLVQNIYVFKLSEQLLDFGTKFHFIRNLEQTFAFGAQLQFVEMLVDLLVFWNNTPNFSLA